jgi:hypothetical protein
MRADAALEKQLDVLLYTDDVPAVHGDFDPLGVYRGEIPTPNRSVAAWGLTVSLDISGRHGESGRVGLDTGARVDHNC